MLSVQCGTTYPGARVECRKEHKPESELTRAHKRHQCCLSLMRTCPTFSVCGHLAYYSRRGAGHDLSWLAARKAAAHSRFYAAAAIAHKASPTLSVPQSPFASSATQPQNRLGHASTLTALHKARELITRILPPQSPELSFWNDVLRDVSDETSRSSLTLNEEKITIVGMFNVLT